MNWFLKRLSEPSSFAGLAAAAPIFSSALHGGHIGTSFVMALMGAVAAFIMPEGAPK